VVLIGPKIDQLTAKFAAMIAEEPPGLLRLIVSGKALSFRVFPSIGQVLYPIGYESNGAVEIF